MSEPPGPDAPVAPSGRPRPGRGGPPRFPTLPDGLRPGTIALHAGRAPDRNAGAVVPPIYETSTFHFPAEHSEVADPRDVRLYSRYENPTLEGAAEVVRALEGAEEARLFSSGMAALSSTVLALARSGDTIVAAEELYGGTRSLLERLLPRYGIRVRWVPPSADGPEEALAPGDARLVLLETPSNPFLRVHDLARWARAADAAGALLVVDNTFATPINQRPIDHGADLVVHSATKYLSGHSDVVAGAVAGPHRLLEEIASVHRTLGGVLDPIGAFLVRRGLRTLGLRVERQNENGRRAAEALGREPGVGRVYYPGLGGPEQEAIAGRQMLGRGGVVAFELTGGRFARERFLGGLRLAHVASSLGGVETLVSAPSETSHAHLSPEARARLGISEGLVRLSCGIEDPGDLLSDLRGALSGGP